jgi:hypothetical protein
MDNFCEARKEVEIHSDDVAKWNGWTKHYDREILTLNLNTYLACEFIAWLGLHVCRIFISITRAQFIG